MVQGMHGLCVCVWLGFVEVQKFQVEGVVPDFVLGLGYIRERGIGHILWLQYFRLEV